MLFGFNFKQEFIPDVFKDLTRKDLNLTFLHQYNAFVDEKLVIPIAYAKNARNFRMIFEKRIQDILKFSFLKAKHKSPLKKFCIFSHLWIKAYKYKDFSALKNAFFTPKMPVARMIQMLYQNEELIFNAREFFINYVYEKIAKQNPKRQLELKDNFLLIDGHFAVLIYAKNCDINQKSNFALEVNQALKMIQNQEFSRFYIIFPKNKNFKRHIEIKHFLSEKNKTMLKLVPYSITNKLKGEIKQCQ
ncbi:hypothetical protein [Campylobacter sp. US33a]|uniref:hypothetical protein n=1 Tax=Campylobacter sp. US33a TaxID=2498120 RepID=UPI001067D305|nr:hypothetical protein [Campylobacter sp. US33a]TEY04511.1 hypothetical protein ELQ16_00340 [Campylobacter sp. US33a]